jgi:pimeloyl-ACP methyl ester carboxylesterase
MTGSYIDLDGRKIWTDERGAGDETILLLHGGLSSGDELLDSIGDALAARHRVVTFDRRGHGRSPDTDAPFSYDEMAGETIAFLERLGTPAHLVGWSDGGILALLVARDRPDLVRRVVLIGANYHYDGMLPVDFAADSPAMVEIFTHYAARAPDGPEHFGAVAEKSFHMFATSPTMTLDDLRAIRAPALVMAGDDEVISLAHTCAMYEALPVAQLAIVPGTSHALPMEKPAETARIILDFLASSPQPETLMPVRRTTS